MAFKMKKPMFLGSPLHKSALKKAKSVVAPIQPGSDPGLLEAGRRYGESLVPEAIDYTIRFNPKFYFDKDKDKTRPKNEGEDPKNEGEDPNKEKETPKNKKEEKKEEKKQETEKKEYSVISLQRKLPQLVQTNEVDVDLAKITNSKISQINNISGTDKFEEAAKKYNMSLETPEDIIRAEERLTWDDDKNEWIPKKELVRVPNLEIQQVEASTPNIPTELPDQAEYIAPETNYAHENSQYDEIAMPTKPNRKRVDAAGPDLSTTTDEDDPRSKPGYQILVKDIDGEKKAVVLYNGHIVDIDELPPEISDQQMSDGRTVRETYIDIQDENELKEAEKSVTNNEGQVITVQNQDQTQTTPGPVNPNIEFQPYPEKTETVKPAIVNPRFRMHKYKWGGGTGGWLPGGKEQYEKDMEEYKNRDNVSAARLRDDRIYNNATPGGPVQMNMIKNGYVPK